MKSIAPCLIVLLVCPAIGGEPEETVDGGQFIDRFLPMPLLSKPTSDTWGADNVIPRDVENGVEDRTWSYWGGNAKLADDGKYHLYVARWREDAERGHMEWRKSLVAHAVAQQPMGPYHVKDTVGPGHNPEVFQLADGRYVIYVIGGYYMADDVNGPWERLKFEFDPRGRRIVAGLSNLTFARREDGSLLMVCRGGGVWFSKTGISPYYQVTDQRVYPPVEGAFEDPVVWRTDVQYHLIVNDWRGRIAYYLRSKDGVDWKIEPGTAYRPGIAVYEDGTKVDWYKYERPKVLQDRHGRATQMHFAVIDVIKNDDQGSDNHSSKHICIPMTVGRLLTILDQRPITSDTKTIRVKITAEDGFNPHTEVNVYSLRFGAPEEVNFGRGCKILKTAKSGDDLIVTFDATGNGITGNNFTAKLLGKTASGKLLFGYARLPWQAALTPALSARPPVLTKTDAGFTITVEVENFGQIASKSTPLSITYDLNGKATELATGQIPPLAPFEKTTIELPCGKVFQSGESYKTTVTIHPVGQRAVTLQRTLDPANG